MLATLLPVMLALAPQLVHSIRTGNGGFDGHITNKAPVPEPPEPSTAAGVVETPIDDLPFPWTYGTIALVSDTAAATACLASMTALSQRSCGRRLTYDASTTVPYAVNCLGCEQLTLDVHRGGCPLGGGRRRKETYVPATHTAFSFFCATTVRGGGTAFPTPTYRDEVLSVPAPTVPPELLRPGAGPAWTPTAMVASRFAEGWCYNELTLGPTDAAVQRRDCDEAPGGRRPTVYTATVTRTVFLKCEACDQSIEIVPTESGCRPTSAGGAAPVVTAAGPTTAWTYACERSVS